ncbi:MAG: helix-turn-helix domain-containing protein [Candidatus Competibacterales bacterium]|nr:helix-turn-helix domain-containing protein [Candidatus Competibacterales bacterium]
MTGKRLSIGRLARASGCKVQTIRYYEQIGLLPEPQRTSGNQRLYRQADLERLQFIRHSRELGFSLDAIRELLALAEHPRQPCEAADRIVREHLREVESRLSRLHALKTELERMVRECAGAEVSQCRVIEVLADHSQCLHDHHTTKAAE